MQIFKIFTVRILKGYIADKSVDISFLHGFVDAACCTNSMLVVNVYALLRSHYYIFFAYKTQLYLQSIAQVEVNFKVGIA